MSKNHKKNNRQTNNMNSTEKEQFEEEILKAQEENALEGDMEDAVGEDIGALRHIADAVGDKAAGAQASILRGQEQPAAQSCELL